MNIRKSSLSVFVLIALLILMSSWPVSAMLNYFDILDVTLYGDCVTTLTVMSSVNSSVTEIYNVGHMVQDAAGNILSSSTPTLRTTDPQPFNYGGPVSPPAILPIQINIYDIGSGSVPRSEWTDYPLVESYTFNPQDDGFCLNVPLLLSGTESQDNDPDGDGIRTGKDNCPYDYNPDQEDGWGSAMGDACDTDWYNRTGQGLAGFVQKNGLFHLHGDCIYLEDGDPRCPVIAAFDPLGFDPHLMPLEIASDQARTWSVWLYYLHSNNGADVYQVNVYSSNPPQPDTLVDDRLEIHVNGESWQWHHRGGMR